MPIPLAAAAAVAGAVRTGFGLISGHQKANRRRSAIYDAYTRGKKRLDLRQGDVRQDTLGSLSARGLTGGGGIVDTGAVAPTPVDYGMKKTVTSIKQAMLQQQQKAGAPTLDKGALLRAGAAGNVPHTLGQQQLADLQGEQLLEQNDMLAARDNGIDDVGAEGAQGAIDSIASGVNTAAGVYNAGKELEASRKKTETPTPGGTPAPDTPAPTASIASVMNPGNWFGGIVGLDPLRTPGSSWRPFDPFNPTGSPIQNALSGTTIGDGQPNYDFRRGV